MSIQNEFVGVEIEARSAAFSAIINLVHSNDWEHLTARQELGVRNKLIKLADKIDNGSLRAEGAIWEAQQWAKKEFLARKENNDTQGYAPRY